MADVTPQDAIARLEASVKYAQAAQAAYKNFFERFFEVEASDLVKKFIEVDVKDSKAVFECKYNLDALNLVRTKIMNAGDAAAFYQNEINAIRKEHNL